MKRLKAKDILYPLAVVLILGFVGCFLFCWWDQLQSRDPEVVTARSYVFQEELPFECRLLWDEEVLTAPLDGTVRYPGGREPRWVSKGEILAVIRGQSGTRSVRAPGVGYFVAGLDGLEEDWSYMALWRGEAPLPPTDGLSLFPEGGRVRRGEALGKYIPQPQDLRAVGYLDGADSIIEEIHRGALALKENPLDLPFNVGVRVARDLGWKRKVYLTFPLFPPRYLRSRSLSLSLCLAKQTGVMVPESAVLQKAGARGVFVVEGSMCRYRTVTGRPLEKGLYLVREGLGAGEIVMVYAEKAKEGKVQLW